MIAPPGWLVAATEPWSALYGASSLVRTAVVGIHLVPLLLGGGVAVALDRATLRRGRWDAPERRTQHLVELTAAHRWVGTALALTLGSGLLLLLADPEQFFGSGVFWIKLGLVAALAVNGVRMMASERALAAQAAGESWDDEAVARWRRLEQHARTSLVLWVLITVAGVVMVNAG